MSISSDEEWHHAKVGLFLVDDDGVLYGLTCKHVTAFPNDGKIYVRTQSGAMESIGTVLYLSRELSNKTAGKFQYDVDVFEVESQFKQSCSNLRICSLRKYRSVNFFKDSRNVLFGSPFSSITDGKVSSTEKKSTKSNTKSGYCSVHHDSVDPNTIGCDTSTIISIESLAVHDPKGISDSNTPLSLKIDLKTSVEGSETENETGSGSCISGQIESEEVHKSESSDLPDYSILLHSCGALFKPGDSGTVIVREKNNTLELLGILTGSYKSESNNENYITCLLLQKGLQILNYKYDKTFHIFHPSKEQRKDNGELILSGSEIWIKTQLQSVKSPEDIADIDYQFVEIIYNLIDNMKDDDISTKNLQLEEENEKLLSNCVSSMGELKSQESICDSPAVRCYYLCMNGCSFLYKGDFSRSIQQLTAAAKMIIKLPCRNRLLCRMITYATWNLLKTEKLKDMEQVLFVAEPYMASMKKLNVCPNSSMGYYFFDYARFYIKQGKINKALEKANASLVQFRQGKKPSVGKILSLAMVARLYLNCGDEFERRNFEIVASRVHEAKELLGEARQPSAYSVVAETTILLTETDLYYRLGNIDQAIESAARCFDLASANNLNEEQIHAGIRIQKLEEMCSKM